MQAHSFSPEGAGDSITKTYKAPSTGIDIIVTAKGDAVVPTGKVEQYMRGNVRNPKQELQELNTLKQSNRKLFDSDLENAKRLEALKKLSHNYNRSVDMASKLENIGLDNTKSNNDTITALLLDAGNKATENNRTIASLIEGPIGRLKVESTWTILPDGTKYLSTIKLIPVD